jgi:hypothetical protein
MTYDDEREDWIRAACGEHERLAYGDYLCDIRREEGKSVRPRCSLGTVQIDAQLLTELYAGLVLLQRRIEQFDDAAARKDTLAWLAKTRERCMAALVSKEEQRWVTER